tara:strand:+ start:1451 stop:2230 length:780 start_codon:yes stop_codon:yes gene_type:complete
MSLNLNMPIHIGLLGAMPEEVESCVTKLQHLKKVEHGDLTIFSGELNFTSSKNQKVQISLAWSGWGKVSAARAATRLISEANKEIPIDLLLFTGVAGAADKNLDQFDIVVAKAVIQHDMDASPIFDKFIIPAIREKYLYSLPKYSKWAYSLLEKSINSGELVNFRKVSQGIIATGDQFISNKSLISKLAGEIPGLSAVEMEGASVAQVAHQEGVPWLIVRVISDSADDKAAENFNIFLEKYKESSWTLIETLLKNINSV